MVSQPLPDAPPKMFGTLELSAEQYLKYAHKASPKDAFSWQVLAIRTWLQEKELAKATKQLTQLRSSATPEQTPVIDLLAAELALANNDAQQAQQLLEAINRDSLKPSALNYYFLQQAHRFEQQHKPIAAADMLVARHEKLAGARQQANLERIYALLAPLSSESLHEALNEEYQDDTQGWLRLMAILNSPTSNNKQRDWQLNSWRSSYPKHPGGYYLPEDLERTPTLTTYQPSHIAVLLPLSGQLASQADAIRNGILQAHQGQSSTLSFFDTATDMSRLYQELQSAGADFIIGPLLKDNIAALDILDPAMPQLALNRPPNNQELAHRYYFALSPESEAAEGALHLWEQGHRQPLVFAPGNALGKRSAAEFNRRWQQLSGQPARVAYFSSKQAIEADVRRALNTSAPKNTDGDAIASGAIDSVFMASNATETRFILPYFDFVRDSRKQRLPTYVTSRSFIPGGQAPMKELNGVMLADMPWIFDQEDPLRATVELQWPNSSSSWLRLFALGYDALSLLPRLPELSTQGGAVPGLTGDLSVNEQGVIERRLQWMEYQDGDWQIEGMAAPDAAGEDFSLDPELEAELKEELKQNAR
ncbi:penicillin-binding protein activator [Oceanisphaera avium]|nr:penicillin-binding protein activator [Oceanisphaera avium]